MTDRDVDSESRTAILSSDPPFTSPEGIAFLVGGTGMFVVSALAIKNIGLQPIPSFVAGMIFVLGGEVVREKLIDIWEERNMETEI